MNAETTKGSARGLLFNCLAAGGLGLVCVLLLLLLAAILISHGALPAELGDKLTLGSAIAGGAVAGLSMRKREGKGALPLGCLGGLSMAAVIAVITALRATDASFDLFSLKLLICGLAGGAFGGVLKVRRKKAKRSRRRK